MNLRPEDAALLIDKTCSGSTILVGGQAVAFWIRYFDIRPRLPALTTDIDYLGTRAEARRASGRLGLRRTLKLATLDDPPPNVAVMAVEMDGYAEPVLIDYLSGVAGLDSGAIGKSAVTIAIDDRELRVIHPVQLLQAKTWNLYQLPGKRSPEGIEQARLAIEVVAAWLERSALSRRELLRAIGTIGKFAATTPARNVREQFRLDCLDAVPERLLKDDTLPAQFREKRWPQIVAAARS